MTAVPHPAATVVLLRDGSPACEVLLVRRNARLSFHGGAWVFPGGRIDAQDLAAAGTQADLARAARHAAVREAYEETSLKVCADDLVLFSRWVTPPNIAKRFDTWFFAGLAGADDVHVDGGEIEEHSWMCPSAALSAHAAGQIELPPPTFVTLTQLVAACAAAETLAALAARPFEYFEPQLLLLEEGACTLYFGDAAYGSQADRPGPRHRLWMRDSGWQYERTEPQR
jgi:8-oxo-dGTP pyrophosphatase MutT (NUDIX family)